MSVNDKGGFIAMVVSEYSEMSYYRALALEKLGREEDTTKLLKELKTYTENKMPKSITLLPHFRYYWF